MHFNLSKSQELEFGAPQVDPTTHLMPVSPYLTDLIWGLLPCLLQRSDGSVKGVTSGSDCRQQLPLLRAQGRQELR